MARSGKWITGFEPSGLVCDVARASLEARLPVVWQFVKLAAASADQDVEYVHQARVSSRRAMAALRIFHDCLPGKPARRMRRLLRKIRRSAGPARDDDVLALRLAPRAEASPAGGAGLLRAEVLAHRATVQSKILKVHKRLVRKRFLHRCEKLAGKVRWRGDGAQPTYREFADAHLRRLLDAFHAAVRADLSQPAAMHALRLDVKRMRYAMEIFVGAYDAAFRTELYPEISQLQELLGEVNDHATALVRFHQQQQTRRDSTMQAALAPMIDHEEQSLAQSQQAFHTWWTPAKASALEALFQSILGGDVSK